MPLAGRTVPGVELAFVAHKAGIPLDQLVMCLAIGWGESNWTERAWNFNENTGDRSYGVWQINMLGRLMAERLRLYGLTHADELYQLPVNARVMASMYRERGWMPWGAYTDGGYRRGLARATEAVELYKRRLAESGDRLHLGGVPDCDSI